MKKNIPFITVLFLFSVIMLFTSCEPVKYKDLSNSVLDTSGTEIKSASNDGSTIRVTFKGIPTVHSYGYQLNGTAGDNGIRKADTEFSDGFYTMKIPVKALEQVVTLDLADGDSADEKYDISIYASRESGNASDWTFVTIVSVPKERPNLDVIPPSGYLYSREIDSAIIQLTDISVPEDVEYGYSLDAEQNIQPVDRDENNRIMISGIESSRDYDITVYHRYSGDSNWGKATFSIQSGTYDSSIPFDIILSAGNSGIAASSIPDEADRIVLVNTTLGRERYEKAGAEDTYVFSFSEFDTGIFQVKAYDGDDIVAVSNYIEYTTPIHLKNTEEGRQHFWAEIDIAPGFDDPASLFDITLDGFNSEDMKTKVELKPKGNKVELTISGLASNSSYTGYIRSGNKSSAHLAINTKDFTGTYIFIDEDVADRKEFDKYMYKFAVEVKLASDVNPNSDCMYYFYVSKEDPNCAEGDEKLILCPLVDDTYKDYNLSEKAYDWNNNKFNTTGISVKSFDISKWTNENDFYKTDVSSLNGLVITTTRFVLEEDKESRELQLEFFNMITGGMLGTSMNSALRQNHTAMNSPDEEAPFTFILEYEGNN